MTGRSLVSRHTGLISAAELAEVPQLYRVLCTLPLYYDILLHSLARRSAASAAVLFASSRPDLVLNRSSFWDFASTAEHYSPPAVPTARFETSDWPARRSPDPLREHVFGVLQSKIFDPPLDFPSIPRSGDPGTFSAFPDGHPRHSVWHRVEGADRRRAGCSEAARRRARAVRRRRGLINRRAMHPDPEARLDRGVGE